MKLLSICLVFFSTAVATAQSTETATVRIDASRVENRISPRMYASFVEMMAEDVKGGMTAEMLHDRSFEEPASYLGLPAAWQLEPDERNDNVAAIKFAQVTEEAYPKVNQATSSLEHSLKVTLAPGDITDNRRGLSHPKISVDAGKTYKGYLWAKVAAKDGYTGDITVLLEQDVTDGATYGTTKLSNVAGEWHPYSFSLTSKQTDRFAKLSLLFNGHGTIYIDQVSLQPDSAIDQVRADSEAMINALHPSFMRWPGGNVAQDYHWQWGIGPRDLRPTWINKSWSNAPEPGDLGTDEYLDLCSRLHIEPSITVNVDGAGATPEEAAAWVEYVNGPASSKYGVMRAANGHPEPYGVKQWELGNEIFGNWVRGHVTGEQYAEAAVRYAKAMRAVDPSLQLIAVGEGILPGSDEWNSAVIKVAGPVIQYLAIHDYTSLAQNSKSPEPRSAMMDRPGEFEANYKHVGELLAQYAPGHPIKLIVNEWNLFYGSDVIQSMEGAVYASRMMNGFERDGDVVDANCISDLFNGWVGGIIQASRDRTYGTPEYEAVKMYAARLGTERLHLETQSPMLSYGTSAVDSVASRSADGSKLFIKMSNADQQASIRIKVDVSGFHYRTRGKATILQARHSGERNTFEAPNLIASHTQDVQCGRSCELLLPADSVAIVTLNAAQR